MTVEIAEIKRPQLQPLDGQRLDRHLQQVYLAAFSLPPYREGEPDVVRFRESFARHVRRPGFRIIVAKDEEQVVGFGYGYTSAPGQWWRDTVDAALGKENSKKWLSDAFELVELAVLPSKQGQGIGGRIHDELLKGSPQHTAVLSTYQTETPALRLYRKRGWVTLLSNFFFPGAGHAFLIMGLDLRARAEAKSGPNNG